jgi:hypothetical protein
MDVEFNGNGAVFKGSVQCPNNEYVADVEVLVDGQNMGTIKLPVSTQDSRKVDIYWIYKLKEGMHKVSFNWLNPDSKAQVYLGDAIVYTDSSKISSLK